jgi:hypothetical protein
MTRSGRAPEWRLPWPLLIPVLAIALRTSAWIVTPVPAPSPVPPPVPATTPAPQEDVYDQAVARRFATAVPPMPALARNGGPERPAQTRAQ